VESINLLLFARSNIAILVLLAGLPVGLVFLLRQRVAENSAATPNPLLYV